MINTARLAKQYHKDFLEESRILLILSLFPPLLVPSLLLCPLLTSPLSSLRVDFSFVFPRLSSGFDHRHSHWNFRNVLELLWSPACVSLHATHTDTHCRMQHAIYYQCMWCTVRGQHEISEIDTELIHELLQNLHSFLMKRGKMPKLLC